MKSYNTYNFIKSCFPSNKCLPLIFRYVWPYLIRHFGGSLFSIFNSRFDLLGQTVTLLGNPTTYELRLEVS